MPHRDAKTDLRKAIFGPTLISKCFQETAVTRETIPEGYGSITPYFTVPDADAFIKFAKTVFGAKVIKEDRYETGRIQHAHLCVGTSILMLNEANEDYPANTSQMHLYVDDADSCYKAALAAGATSLMAPNTRPHGDRMAGIKDPSSNVWWLATPKTV
ncbi:VOC family protein [uncultured Pelagimonas sp.]|uniref:VOC family protein n=1 Tax=uncultured Pelagimonas sp. TaxID=1618102 RepID=UPI0026332BF5|nr:VOC family protein [uncultured Pelagimonas sp.]